MRASIRTRLLAAFLVVAVTAAAGLSFYFLKELEGYALRKLEERLHTQAWLLAVGRVDHVPRWHGRLQPPPMRDSSRRRSTTRRRTPRPGCGSSTSKAWPSPTRTPGDIGDLLRRPRRGRAGARRQVRRRNTRDRGRPRRALRRGTDPSRRARSSASRTRRRPRSRS